MSILFPSTPLSEHEEKLVIEVFSNPVVKKYLHNLASTVASDMVTAINEPTIDPQTYIRAQFLGKGRLDLVESLLNLQQFAASTVESNSQEN